MVSLQVLFLQKYKGGGVCIEYKQGTVGNWLPIAANECVGGVCGGRGEGGCKDITESYGGDQVNLSFWRTKILLPHPHPLPQVMNNDQPPFSYLFIYIFLFFYSIYLFILFVITFFP